MWRLPDFPMSCQVQTHPSVCRIQTRCYQWVTSALDIRIRYAPQSARFPPFCVFFFFNCLLSTQNACWPPSADISFDFQNPHTRPFHKVPPHTPPPQVGQLLFPCSTLGNTCVPIVIDSSTVGQSHLFQRNTHCGQQKAPGKHFPLTKHPCYITRVFKFLHSVF